MRLYDIIMVVVILTIFALLIGHKSVSVNVKNISDDWPQQRCNPLYMPFADDPVGNLTFCIQKAQREYMDDLMLPLNNSMSVFGNTINSVLDSVDFIRTFLDYLRTSIINIVGGIYSVFLNIIIEFQRSTIAVKDMMGKMMGVMVSLIYMVDGSVKTAEATWNGPPGKLIRGLCFDKDTFIQHDDGNYSTIEHVPLGARLKDGSEIIGKLTLNNKNKDGTIRQKFMTFPDGGEKATPIFVTADHFVVMPNGSWNYVKNHPDSVECIKTADILYCLITNTRKIAIGNYVFHDWEDNDEMHENIHN
jgi:hypothetical protein